MLIYLVFLGFIVKLELDVRVGKTQISLLLWQLRKCMLSILRNYMALK